MSLLGAGGVGAEEIAPFPPLTAGEQVDEVIVRARSLQRLQVEVFRAEQSFYDAFNAANTDHELDIYCEFRAPTGTHIQQRVCRAAFVTTLEAKAAEAGRRGEDPFIFYAQMKAKEPLLHDELRNVVAKHPEALAALMNVGTARQSFDNEKARRCDGRVLFCRRR